MVVVDSDFNILTRSTGGREMLSTTGFDSFPDDILMQILIRIPAHEIVDSTKFVCRKWHEITRTRDFADAHLHHSTPGLLVRNHDRQKTATFMSLANEGNQVQISDFNHSSGDGYLWTGCNGLTLEPKINEELMITNLVTRHHFDLPPFFATTIPPKPNCRSAIAYVATRKEYKVVRTYCPVGDYSRVYCAILTVGVDNSWRLVDTQHLSPMESTKLILSTLVTEGFVHWVDNCDGYDNKHILSLNMDTEVMSQILAPRCCTDRYYYDYTYLSSAGSSLSLLIGVGRLKWEVWEMKPLESGEYCWTKLPDIDLEAHSALLNESFRKEENEDADRLECCVRPSGWLKYREVIVFFAFKHLLSRRARFHVVYNVQTKDVSLYKADYYCSHPHLVHRNSLVQIC